MNITTKNDKGKALEYLSIWLFILLPKECMCALETASFLSLEMLYLYLHHCKVLQNCLAAFH